MPASGGQHAFRFDAVIDGRVNLESHMHFPGWLIDRYAANRLALVHQVERIIDLFERHLVRNQVVDIDLAVHVPVHDLRHIGAPAGSAECRALPHPPGDELKGPGLDDLSGAGDADDHRYAPAAMAAFERLTHDVDIADAFEAVVRSSVREAVEMSHEILANILRIDEMRHAEFFGERPAARIDVDADNLVRAHEPCRLNDVEPDAAEAEHHHVRTRLDLR